ncbi:hypothetical protein DDV21_001055 [Streptococcus chenjunshii]|uniref:Uncharacterized protein n=1 Tax=Streptococcus chenjunshii TaxID=2173853 RepID=A0A372KK96_9STRE|nr:hypothetical protein DDV21_001055 [Streptococcus chenjunshii]RFU50481.1 hypothetical protein DDV22_08390 [Streptococcus chenjunshii]RFU52709.1 hypothetical protein DDV23_08230 [Streptococcus chenjunshii]
MVSTPCWIFIPEKEIRKKVNYMYISDILTEILYAIVKGILTLIGLYIEQIQKRPIITIGLTILFIHNWL